MKKQVYSALKLRRSQLITGFGVGAIVDIDNQSLIGKDISTWSSKITKSKKYRLDKIPRLEKLLGINHIVCPPSAPSEIYGNASTQLSIPYHRFPQWLECRKCNALKKYSAQRYEQDYKKIICHSCGADSKNLTPIRYIFAPEDGCLNDIEWPYVLHANTPSNACTDKDNLEIYTLKGKGGGLSSIEVKCKTCGTKKNMNQIKQDLHVQTTRGVQPWEGGAAMSNPPKQNPKHSNFQLRGATSLYQPQIVGGLDLSGTQWESEDSNSINDYLDGNDNIERLKNTLKDFEESNVPPEATKELYKKYCKIFNQEKPNDIDNISIQDIKDYLSQKDTNERPQEVNLEEVSDENLKKDEFELLDTDGHQVFKNYDGEKYKVTDQNLSSYIESVTQIKKLREVRVLKGYTRHFNPKFHSVNSSENWLPFLPGYEVFGEGFFIQFNIKSIEKWQKKYEGEIKLRLSEMQHRQKDSNFLPFPTAKFVLVHTFSHLLIKQLCFQSGYQAASIKERLYVNDSNMCGVLIYTADADSEGSLGGLVRMSDENRLSHSIKSMLDTAGWCSADPTCIEIGSPGTRGLNKAACHACCLISETSCAYMNALLDRGLLIGSKSENLKGYFDQ